MRMSAVASGAQSSQPVVVCHLIPGLPKRQRQLCQMHPDAMLAVMDGAKQAVSECQRQFANHRWNCTTMEKGRILLKREFLGYKLYTWSRVILNCDNSIKNEISGTTDTSGLLKIAADSETSYNQYISASKVKKSPILKRKFGISDQDLVFYDLSPDYCANDVRGETSFSQNFGESVTPSLKKSPDPPDLGAPLHICLSTVDLDCRFIWCCQVECETCEKLVESYTCKPHSGAN
uniref:Protein Wnt n=1 Tax=Romanomermis culicivorax TaxID=13658 RepID=A0A915JKB8_ROMCU